MGALDYAGGTVVHLNAGTAGLVAALMLGKRKGLGTENFAPFNPAYAVIGASLLWVGWFGFNAGSAVEAHDGQAGMAAAATQIATAAAALAWMFMEWIIAKKPTVIGMASGAVAGLVAITPASGFVNPTGALIIGIAAGVVCYFAAVHVKKMLGFYDDALDCWGVHGVGGALGALLTGVFASNKINSAAQRLAARRQLRPDVAAADRCGGGVRLLRRSAPSSSWRCSSTPSASASARTWKSKAWTSTCTAKWCKADRCSSWRQPLRERGSFGAPVFVPAQVEPVSAARIETAPVSLEDQMSATHTKSSSAKTRRTRRTGRRDPLAVKLLKTDHREVEGMFDEYEQLEADAEKLALFKKIALALKVHTQIEEEIFYPEERGDVEDDLLDEA